MTERTCFMRATTMSAPVGWRFSWLLSLATAVACGTQADDGSRVSEVTPPSPGETSSAPVGQWLSGDMHLHSDHSTDAADSPVADLVAVAEAAGFGYFVLTDHDNHVEGAITTWSDPAYQSDSMTLLYGTEWTTGMGHANLFGTAPWDHPSLYAIRDGDGAASIAAAHDQGLHFSVNHPINDDGWEHSFDLAYDSMEIWNAVFLIPNANPDAIALWDDLLRGGRRLTGRGGSDHHHLSGIESLVLDVGNPTTWIFVEEDSPQAVLDGLKAGHVSISYAPSAERIDFTADADGDGIHEAMMGDDIASDIDRTVAFRIEIDRMRAGASYDISVLKDGEAFEEWTTASRELTFEDTIAAGERTYYRVEVRGETPDAPALSSVAFDGFVGMTNPIYVGYEGGDDGDDGTDDGSTDDSGTDDSGTDDSGTDDSGTDDSGTDDGSTDDGSTDDGSTDDGGTDGGGTDEGSTDDGDAADDAGTGEDDTDDGDTVDDGGAGEDDEMGSGASCAVQRRSSHDPAVLGGLILLLMTCGHYRRRRCAM